MPVWTKGTPIQRRKSEAAKTQGTQVQSLTFIDRAAPATQFDATNHPFGLLLESATNSLLDAGFSIRTQPRFQIGNRSNREYEQPIAITPGRGGLDFVFNPQLRIHRELQRPYDLKSAYMVRSIMAPPYMNMIAGEYDHLSSSPVNMSADDQAVMSVELLDQYGAEYIPARLYQLTAMDRSSQPYEYTFTELEGQDDETLAVEEDASTGAPNNFVAASFQISVNNSGAANDGEFALHGTTIIPHTTGDTHYDGIVLLHMPGENGGYVVSGNLRTTDLSTASTVFATDATMAKRFNLADPIVAYLGVYATPSRGLLFRDP